MERLDEAQDRLRAITPLAVPSYDQFRNADHRKSISLGPTFGCGRGGMIGEPFQSIAAASGLPRQTAKSLS
jgi:hypothetical protein